MKKIISLILCFSLIFSIFNISAYAIEEVANTEDVEGFCEELTEMVNDYADSEFVTPDSSVIEEITDDLYEETEINFCSRLIVQSDNRINTYNAIDVVSGFSNFYILQFENEKDTNYAYEQYKADENIISISYDVSYNAIEAVTEGTTETTYEDYQNAWYLNSTGINAVLDKYKNKNLPEVVVAVVDSGVDLNCKYFKNRIKRTYYNSTEEYDVNSEQDYNGHGTMVTSMIINCTTDNVKVANYRIFKEDGKINSVTLAATTVLQAVNDGADIVNCSFSALTIDELFSEVIKYAYKSDCFVVNAAGNIGNDLGLTWGTELQCSPLTITVGASNIYGIPSYFTNYGKEVDVLAPGETVPVIHLNNVVGYADGTSFSSPLIAGITAMHCSIYPLVSFEERVRIIKNSGNETDEKYVTDLFGSGIVDALKLFKLDELEPPAFSLSDEKIIGEVALEIFAEDGADIYYTTDYTYPSPANGTLYTEPIKIYDDFKRIRAVAYKNGKRSCFVKKDIYSFVLGTDDMFEINNSGVITLYSGKVNYLKIPEVINGITVKDISYYSGFRDAEIYGVILPDTLKYLGSTLDEFDRNGLTVEEQLGPFNNNKTLEYISGKNIEVIGYRGVSFLENLTDVDFPNCERIMFSGFYSCGLYGGVFPKVKIIETEAFCKNTNLREIYLPECTSIGNEVFINSSGLSKIYIPKIGNFKKSIRDSNKNILIDLFNGCFYLTEIDLPELSLIGENSFKNTAVKILELSQCESLYDIPSTICLNDKGELISGWPSHFCEYYMPVPIELALPSTLKYCVPAEEYKYPEINSFCVYGTKGTYAEEWAKENEIEFIEITQETSIREDIEPIWDEWSYKPLEFDARGFNRTYQWYGYNKTKETAVAITGATDKTFNPEDYKQYEYYYCVMTSVDGDSVVTVTSGTCHNKMYNMFAIKDTYIDYDNNLIYTQQTLQKNFDNILKIQDDTSYYVVPSYVYKKNSYYGTGSQFLIYSGGVYKETFTLIVQGDVNGDSVVDVLDLMSIELATNNHIELNSYYHTAADANMDGEISVEDFSNIVNLIVTG